jgi:hypothetical protein
MSLDLMPAFLAAVVAAFAAPHVVEWLIARAARRAYPALFRPELFRHKPVRWCLWIRRSGSSHFGLCLAGRWVIGGPPC